MNNHRKCKWLTLLLTVCLLTSTLVGCTKTTTTETTPPSTSKQKPVIGTAGMTPSEILDILPNVEWVVIEYNEYTPIYDTFNTYTKNGNMEHYLLYRHSNMNFSTAVGQEYMDYGNSIHYSLVGPTGQWWKEPSTFTWQDRLNQLIINDPELLPAFDDKVYGAKNEDGSQDADLRQFPYSVKSVNFKSSDTVYTFTFEIDTNYYTENITIVLKIGFVQKDVELPTNAKPVPEDTESVPPESNIPTQFSQVTPQNWKTISPRSCPSIRPDDGKEYLSPNEFFYDLHTDQNLKIFFEYKLNGDPVYTNIYRDGHKLYLELLESGDIVLDCMYIDLNTQYKYYQENGKWTKQPLEAAFTWDTMMALLNERINYAMKYTDSAYKCDNGWYNLLVNLSGIDASINWAKLAKYDDCLSYQISYNGYDSAAYINVDFDDSTSILFPRAS